MLGTQGSKACVHAEVGMVVASTPGLCHQIGAGQILGCRGDDPQLPLGAEHVAPMRMSVTMMLALSGAVELAAGQAASEGLA